MTIRKSAEDYLEAILRLRARKGYARSVDIAAALGVSGPSVSVAMQKLRNNGCIEMDASGFITLTDEGMAIASRIYERHRVLKALLMSIGVDEATAEADACRVEHDLSEETFDAIRRTVERQL